jgi:WD40 repeat protein
LNAIVPKNWSGPELEASEESTLLTADAPILSYLVLERRFIVYTSISGSLSIYDSLTRRLVSRKDHTKYAIQVVSVPEPTNPKTLFLATAGWDRKVFLYLLIPDENLSPVHVQEPIASLELPSLPESLLFHVDERDDSSVYLICSRRDSTFLYFYRINNYALLSSDHATPDVNGYQLVLAGKQNLAPYANSWSAFSPSCLAVHPTDATLIAVATSSQPHMKVLLVRLLLPNSPTNHQQQEEERHRPLDTTRAEQHHEAREAAAVLFHVNALISQTQYSLPLVTWRPDGSGVWVASDEGVIKGLDLSGKIVCELRGGHDAGSKIRCLDVGYVCDDEREGRRREYLVSGGFDGKVVVWMD